MTVGSGENPEWSDTLNPADEDPADAFKAHVLPRRREPTRIVLDGHCPRCRHPMISVHRAQGAMPQELARDRYPQRDDDRASTASHNYRIIATHCQCVHEHKGRPNGEVGCGAPISVGVRWTKSPPHQADLARVETTPFEHQDERTLQAALTTQLADVRKAAESWRTGLGAFLTVLAAVFFVKGATTFDDLAVLWQVLLAVLLLASAATAIYGAYRAIRAAYGTPADEYLAGSGRLWSWMRDKTPATTPRRITDYDAVGAWQDALVANTSKDLRHAKVATAIAASFFAAAAIVTWFGAGPAGTERVLVQGRTASVCGKAVTRRGGVLVIDSAREVRISDVVSIKPVPECPPR